MSVVVKPQPRFVGGRIELMSAIGEGGCASVWLGRHRETNNLVAAKLVHSRQDQDLLAMRFQREAELSARLVHRNLVRVHDYFREEDGQPVLLMEYLRGQTVEEVLQSRGSIPVEAAIGIVVAVLRGLHQAHELGIIHRDIKPSNIFLAAEPDGVVIPKLLDFGIAKSQDIHAISLTQDGEVLGTPAYMSPEQVRGGEIDAGTDIFSMGAVLYEMLTGKLAFQAGTPSAALAAVLERKVEYHPAIPELLWPVISRALSKKAADRPRSVEELRWELEEATGYGESSGQQAIQDLHISVPKLPLLPPLTGQPFAPVGVLSTQQRLRVTSPTMAAPSSPDSGEESALITTTPSEHLEAHLPRRRLHSWLLAGGACVSIALAVTFAMTRDTAPVDPAASHPETSPNAASQVGVQPAAEIPPPDPISANVAPVAVPVVPVASAVKPAASAAPKKPRPNVGRNPGF